jgi:arsenate reductase (thioredoxin)
MSNKVYNVLFLCTGNSARSILAAALLNSPLISQGRFKAYSAGSHPTGVVNPFAIELLREMKLSTEGLRSKPWDEFAAPGAPPLDFVITVCDNAAGEVCPIWPGRPMTAHWGVEDPSAAEGSDERKRHAFTATANQLRNRIQILANLPLERLDHLTLKQKLTEIGQG